MAPPPLCFRRRRSASPHRSWPSTALALALPLPFLAPGAAPPASSSDDATTTPTAPPRPPAVVTRAVAALARVLDHDSLKYLLAGAVAGIVSRTVVSPLEVLATMSMCSVATPATPTLSATALTTPAAPSLITQLRLLFAREGLRGFFKGNAANCMKVAPTKGIQFLTFEAFKRIIHRRKAARRAARGDALLVDPPLTPWERLAAGGAAGMTAALVCYPLEVAKTLLTAHPETYRGVFSTLRAVARNKGVAALYRGISPTLVAMFPYVGLEFMLYEQLKLLYVGRVARRRAGHDSAASRLQPPSPPKASTVVLLLMGAAAGTVAQTVCHPLDVIRKRLQLQGIGGRPIQYRSILHTARTIVHTEGALSLYKGLQPTYMSVLPSAGVSYVVYEAIKTLLNVRSLS